MPRAASTTRAPNLRISALPTRTRGRILSSAMRISLCLIGAMVFGAASLLDAGCATYESELQRSEEHFTRDEHEASLAGLRMLEADWTHLGVRDQARYCYLRGMTDYRIGFKADARHWLAVAAQIDEDTPGSLVPSERSLVNEKLGELNSVIWQGDVLAIEEPPGLHHPKKVETTKTEGATDETPVPATKTDKASDDESPMPKAKPKKPEE